MTKLKSKSYTIKRISRDISITGHGDDHLWQSAELLEDFSKPWSEYNSAGGHSKDVCPKVQFRALSSENYTYFLFCVFDGHIQDKLDTLTRFDTVDCDRVELFLAQNLQLAPYYPLEIDPLARILDAKAHYYRNIDFEWFWPAEQIQIASVCDKQAYTVEFALSHDSLERLQLKQQGAQGCYLLAGLFCAYYPYVSEVEQREAQWISWVKPNSKKPDFHIPSAFAHLYYA